MILSEKGVCRRDTYKCRAVASTMCQVLGLGKRDKTYSFVCNVIGA